MFAGSLLGPGELEPDWGGGRETFSYGRAALADLIILDIYFRDRPVLCNADSGSRHSHFHLS